MPNQNAAKQINAFLNIFIQLSLLLVFVCVSFNANADSNNPSSQIVELTLDGVITKHSTFDEAVAEVRAKYPQSLSSIETINNPMHLANSQSTFMPESQTIIEYRLKIHTSFHFYNQTHLNGFGGGYFNGPNILTVQGAIDWAVLKSEENCIERPGFSPKILTMEITGEYDPRDEWVPVSGIRTTVAGCPSTPYMAYSDFIRAKTTTATIKVINNSICTKGYGNPCDVGTGNKYQTEVDYQSKDFNLTRYYTSVMAFPSKNKFGFGWSHSFGGGLIVEGYSNSISLVKTNGKLEIFQKRSTDVYESLSNPSQTLILNDSLWSYKKGNITYKYSSETGALKQIVDNNGRATNLIYDEDSGDLLRVVAPSTRELLFNYQNGKLASVQLPTDDFVKYEYNESTGTLASVIYADDSSRQYIYDDPNYYGLLTGIIDENNIRYATWSYDDLGRVISSEHAGEAEKVNFAYSTNAYGVIETALVTDALGNQQTVKFQVKNGQNRLSSVVGSKKNIINVRDAYGKITSIYDALNNKTTLTYNDRNLVVEKKEAEGTVNERLTETAWHGVFNKPVSITKGNAKTEYSYDSNGQLLELKLNDLTTSQTRIISYTYNAQGLLESVDGPRTDVQDITTYTYNDKGNLLTTENALGHQSHIYEYDGAGRPMTIHDENNTETVLTYSARGWLKTSRVSGGDTQYFYDKVGNVTDIIAPDGSTITYTYDDANRLTDITDKHGNSIHYELNAMGGILEQQIKDPQGTLTMTRSTVRDELNRIKHSIGANVEEDVETNYDDNGNVDNSVDAYQRVTDNSFDALNRVTQTQDTAGGITQSRYDQYGNVNEIEDPRGLITTYSYNALGDLKTLESPDTGITTYTHDAAGNIKTQTDANSITVTYTYDALNRLTDVTYPDAAENIHYGYDEYDNWDDVNFGRGRLTSITDQSGTTHYKYYGNGLVYNETRTIAGTAYTFGYQYNLADKLTHIIYPSGMDVEYIRDDAGKIVAVTANRDGQATTLADNLQYLPFGPQTNLQFGNGYIQANNYNLNYQLQSINTGNVLSLDYTHDYMGNIDSIQNMLNGLFDQTFTLDNLYRIDIAAGEYGVIDYDLDATGNRVAITEDGAAINYTVDANSNRISTMGDTSFGYDATGNTTVKSNPAEGWIYNYNQNGRLESVEKDGNNIAQYIYNALGQRTQKTTEQGTTTQLFNSSAQLLAEITPELNKEYIYLGGQVLASYTAEAAQTTAPGACPGTTATNSEHEAAGRAYTTSETTGETCWGTFCWGGTITTTWYVQGSSENLGISGTTSNTLYENGANNWQITDPGTCVPTGPCQSISSTNQEHTNNSRAYTSTEMVGQTCWGTFCWGGTEQTVYKAQGSNDDLGSDANTQNTLYQDPNGSFFLIDPETCPLELEDPNYTGFAYFHNDHLGTPRVVTAEDGATLWKGDYNPFGKVKETLAEGVVFEQNIRFPGQYHDRETNLYYNYFRYYQADLGRYLTSDPIGLAGGINTYDYVGGNPVMFVDPLGNVRWKGAYMYYSVGISKLGAGIGDYNLSVTLVSECVNGKRAFVVLNADLWTGGAGVSLLGFLSSGTSVIDYEDGLSDIDPNIFVGETDIMSFGTIIGGYTGLKLGSAVISDGWGLGIGTDIIGVSGASGESVIQSLRYEDCSDCSDKN